MIGLGTIINVSAVLLGGGAGLLVRAGLEEKLKESKLIKVQGLAVMALGLSGVLGPLGTRNNDLFFFLISLILGTLIGELLGLEIRLDEASRKLKERFSGGEGFSQGFILASLTMCLGAMGIVGALEDALFGDISILLTKSVLDSFTAFMLASFYGPGVLLSALPLAIWQGSFTLLARILAPLLTEGVLHGLSLVGNLMIFAIGINLVFDKKLPLVNMLPALLVGALLGVFM